MSRVRSAYEALATWREAVQNDAGEILVADMRRRAFRTALDVEDDQERAELLRDLGDCPAPPVVELVFFDAIEPDDDEGPDEGTGDQHRRRPLALDPREARRQLEEELARARKRARKLSRPRAA